MDVASWSLAGKAGRCVWTLDHGRARLTPWLGRWEAGGQAWPLGLDARGMQGREWCLVEAGGQNWPSGFLEESSSENEDAHSPAIPESPPPHPPLSLIPRAKIATTTVENAASLIDKTMRRALVYQNTILETLDSTIDASKSRFNQIRDTSIAHTSQKIIVSEYNIYEHMVFAKIKETRIFVYYNTLRMLSSKEALLSRVDLRVKKLRQSLDRLTAESEKLEVSLFLLFHHEVARNGIYFLCILLVSLK
ncbi:unnamed protein product [Eruca vesicaria subsp. sativa]|uniref:Uncharacterized protein n=1 Tax=Eruca vesicaria subsp. sativa TaxID=29727 RepID=A0ABC8JRW5_ERUVS|nr:unnamed protein product [Eruca vesicaria subsp. sativa]